MTPSLYLVPTPIGNLGDMTFRAVEILRSAQLVAAEDTRTSGYLLQHYGISTPLISYHKFNERARTDELLKMLGQGQSIALITDAGTPGISDPCAIIVREAIRQGVRVEALPGPTAVIPALVTSGLPTDRFLFLGFPPDKKSEFDTLMGWITKVPATLIFYESPHKIIDTLGRLAPVFGGRPCVLAREISKLHEEYIRGTLNDILENREQFTWKGEYVVMIGGYIPKAIPDAEISEILVAMIGSGMSGKKAVQALVQETGLPKNRVYDLMVGLKDKGLA